MADILKSYELIAYWAASGCLLELSLKNLSMVDKVDEFSN